jgi:hypothetical protein
MASDSPLREEYENKGVQDASLAALHRYWWISARRPIFTWWLGLFLWFQLEIQYRFLARVKRTEGLG